jgi:hypothetical protein
MNKTALELIKTVAVAMLTLVVLWALLAAMAVFNS